MFWLVFVPPCSIVILLPSPSDGAFVLHCIQVLEWGGSVLDIISIAVRAALHNTSIPRLIVTGHGEEVEVEVSDNPYDSTHISVDHAPIIITLAQVTYSGRLYTVIYDHLYSTDWLQLCGGC